MSYLEGTATFTDPNGGGATTLDPVTYEPIYIPAPDPIVVTNATFNQLSSTEQAARQQLQENGTHKIRIDLNDINKTIDYTFEVTTEGIEYKITGKPKQPIMGDGRITIYLLKKGA